MRHAVGVTHAGLTGDVGAWFTGDRLEGVADANLAHHRPHVPHLLAQARSAVGAVSRTDPARWHLMRQVHGSGVGVVDESTPLGAELRDVDVLVTTLFDRPLVVLAADCIPLLAAGRAAIGAAHAGWRGLRADVPGALVDAMQSLGERPEDLHIVLGPTIGPCCYEVGEDVVTAIGDIDPAAVTVTTAGTTSVDLRAAARTRLHELGVRDVADLEVEATSGATRTVCTSCDEGWFSHRRDRASGRHAGIVVRTRSPQDSPQDSPPDSPQEGST